MASAHVIFKQILQRLRVAVSREEKFKQKLIPFYSSAKFQDFSKNIITTSFRSENAKIFDLKIGQYITVFAILSGLASKLTVSYR